ncbi:MAG: hypothetical protein M1321_02110 [Candidatus Marsarchaeota archaeon]|jgi:hypothetical protein|nr:hypothetical protein [Candidatus Marsarchaeota archaeon]
MPYIKKELRPPIDARIRPLIEHLRKQDPGAVDGQVNYAITILMRGIYTDPKSYSAINRAVGVLGCVLQEFYRTEAASYEDKKRKENPLD